MKRRTAKQTIRVHPDDVRMWAGMSNNPMFSEAVRKINAMRCEVEVLWHKGASSLEVIAKEQQSAVAVRKRTRKVF